MVDTSWIRNCRVVTIVLLLYCPVATAWRPATVHADPPKQAGEYAPARFDQPQTEQKDKATNTEQAEGAKAEPAADKGKTVAELFEPIKRSIVVISVEGRDGGRGGMGTGFIVSPDGLIATNLHVVGDARPITIQTADGKVLEVTHVHATDRLMDLALLKVNASGLPALELGDSDTLKQGEEIFTVGTPQGLQYSVVTGVVSANREIEGREMIELHIPIEPGNSGGPLVDLRGKVHGILTMKSIVTPNLGFAIKINALKPMIERPNPIPMSNWLTIGAIDRTEWTPLMGSRWRQRAGRIIAEGFGSGFGGRTLCISSTQIPERPYEVEVQVRMDDESGAAGLVFASDGGDKHFGFYPSAGGLRLTKFDGADVTSWQVLRQDSSPHYQAGNWNLIKVRIDTDKLQCFVNDQLVYDMPGIDVPDGKVGLAKFRQTRAEFRRFRVGKDLPASGASAEFLQKIDALVEAVPLPAAAPHDAIRELATEPEKAAAALRDKALKMEQKASQLRTLANAVHARGVLDQLAKLSESAGEDLPLMHAALLVARLDNEDVDPEHYLRQISQMVEQIKSGLKPDADEAARFLALQEYFFKNSGFHGSRHDYYNRANSYMNQVLDDREGLPITLSIVYMEFARQLQLNVAGIGVPGHFMVRYTPAEGEPTYVDVFEGGKLLTLGEMNQYLTRILGEPPTDQVLLPMPSRAILVRMLRNLISLARDESNLQSWLRYLDASLVLEPESAESRWMRAIVRAQSGDREEAKNDVQWLIDHHPEGLDIEQALELRRRLEE